MAEWVERMRGRDVPEVARALGLEGADILAWPAFRPHPMLERIARTRADENRAYMAAAWPGGGMLISPDGGPIQVSPEVTQRTM